MGAIEMKQDAGLGLPEMSLWLCAGLGLEVG
jgi:hypothetical protein